MPAPVPMAWWAERGLDSNCLLSPPNPATFVFACLCAGHNLHNCTWWPWPHITGVATWLQPYRNEGLMLLELSIFQGQLNIMIV